MKTNKGALYELMQLQMKIRGKHSLENGDKNRKWNLTQNVPSAGIIGQLSNNNKYSLCVPTNFRPSVILYKLFQTQIHSYLYINLKIIFNVLQIV